MPDCPWSECDGPTTEHWLSRLWWPIVFTAAAAFAIVASIWAELN